MSKKVIKSVEELKVVELFQLLELAEILKHLLRPYGPFESVAKALTRGEIHREEEKVVWTWPADRTKSGKIIEYEFTH